MQKRKATAYKYRAHTAQRSGIMFEKTIIDIWFDEDSFNQFQISINDEGTLFLKEILPEVIK